MKDSAITPEEKLLRLIKPAKKNAVAATVLAPQPAAINPIVRAQPPAPSPKRISHLKKYYSLCKPFLNMAVYQKLAWVALAVSAVLFIFSLVYPAFGLKKISLPKAAKETVVIKNYDKGLTAKPFESYMQSVMQHQIFNTVMPEAASEAIIATESDRVKDFALMGIIADSDPQAILEDKKSHEIYYVRQGQSVGEMKIASIEARKIIIQYRGARYEFSL
jgi:hypothetical protein